MLNSFKYGQNSFCILLDRTLNDVYRKLSDVSRRDICSCESRDYFRKTLTDAHFLTNKVLTVLLLAFQSFLFASYEGSLAIEGSIYYNERAGKRCMDCERKVKNR